MKRKWKPKELIDFELALCEDFKKGMIGCPLHLNGGNEHALIKIFDLIKDEDYVLSTHRNHYHYLLKGGDQQKLIAEIYGNESGINGGRARSMNICDPSINFYASAIVAGMCPIACGIGIAIKKDYPKGAARPHVWVFCGDGCEDSGHFFESARFANSRALPVTFVIEDNDYSIDSTKAQRWHNYSAINMPNIIRYSYKRVYPHVGIGEHVTF